MIRAHFTLPWLEKMVDRLNIPSLWWLRAAAAKGPSLRDLINCNECLLLSRQLWLSLIRWSLAAFCHPNYAIKLNSPAWPQFAFIALCLSSAGGENDLWDEMQLRPINFRASQPHFWVPFFSLVCAHKASLMAVWTTLGRRMWVRSFI